jgi:hypothetical protein
VNYGTLSQALDIWELVCQVIGELWHIESGIRYLELVCHVIGELWHIGIMYLGTRVVGKSCVVGSDIRCFRICVFE